MSSKRLPPRTMSWSCLQLEWSMTTGASRIGKIPKQAWFGEGGCAGHDWWQESMQTIEGCALTCIWQSSFEVAANHLPHAHCGGRHRPGGDPDWFFGHQGCLPDGRSRRTSTDHYESWKVQGEEEPPWSEKSSTFMVRVHRQLLGEEGCELLPGEPMSWKTRRWTLSTLTCG